MSISFPSADFVPTLSGYTGQGAFRFWCQKVLPIVYDDSLSYYELLNKVVIYLNNVIKDFSSVVDNFDSLLNCFYDLQDYVNSYFSSIDVQEEINNKLDAMALDGSLSVILAKTVGGRLNIKSVIAGELTDENFNEAVANALAVNTSIYIPGGYYHVRVELSEIECDILCAPDAVFYHGDIVRDGLTHYGDVFQFNRCKVVFSGGVFTHEGEFSRESVANHSCGVFKLNECHESTVENVTFNSVTMKNCIMIDKCRNTVVKSCVFNEYLGSGVHLFYHCTNTVVQNCFFHNAKKAVDDFYCYFTCTGVYTLDAQDLHTPPDGVKYIDNYCDGSEDCGLDTHGATNVLIENNVVYNSSVCITAYNDSGRVERPSGWVMTNVIIRNNKCVSNVRNQDHPIAYMFIFHDKNNSYLDIENVIIENNYVENILAPALISIRCGKNIIVKNNYFRGRMTGDSFPEDLSVPNYLIPVADCMNVEVAGNRCVGGSVASFNFAHCYGTLERNVCVGPTQIYAESVSKYNYLKGSQTQEVSFASRMFVRDDCFTYQGRQYIVSSFGLRVRSGAYELSPLNVTVEDGLCVSDSASPFICNQTVIFNDGSNNYTCYIGDIIDDNTFKIYGYNIPDGVYTVTAAELVTYEVTNPNVAIRVNAGTSTKNLTQPGLYFAIGEMGDIPSDLAGTSSCTLHVFELSSALCRQILFGGSAGSFYVKTLTKSTGSGAWYKYSYVS